MKPQELTDQLIDYIFENVDVAKLDDWNTKFITSTETWWKKSRKLSDKQKRRLGEIWEKQLGDTK